MLTIKEFDRRVNTSFNKYSKLKNGDKKLADMILSIINSKSDISNMMEDLVPKYLNLNLNTDSTNYAYTGGKAIVRSAEIAISEAENILIPLEDMDKHYIETLKGIEDGIRYGAYHLIAHNFALIYMTNRFNGRNK